jgi:hypothetical protein
MRPLRQRLSRARLRKHVTFFRGKMPKQCVKLAHGPKEIGRWHFEIIHLDPVTYDDADKPIFSGMSAASKKAAGKT